MRSYLSFMNQPVSRMKIFTCAECGDERYAGKECYCGSEDLELTMQDVASLIGRRTVDKLECASCGKSLIGHAVQAYQHENGWHVGVLPSMRWWLSIQCPECNYHTSFDKFGIKR